MDVVFLSRIQFALTTMFHILFSVLTIGLSLFLVVEFLWLKPRRELHYRIYRFWARIFAINFGVGVVTGVVLEFEFGTNFSQFSQAVSNVFSPLLAFELLTAAFFAPLQVDLGNRSGVEVFYHQPAKLAAMEAHWGPTPVLHPSGGTIGRDPLDFEEIYLSS